MYDNDQSLNARDVLNYLKDKFADMKVRGNVEFIGQFNKMQNMNIGELVEWVQKCTSSMLKFSQQNEFDDVTTTPKDKLAVLLMLMFHSDKIQYCMSFIGKHNSVRLKEVVDLIKDGSESSTEIVLTAQRKTKPKKKLQGPKCYFCGECHPIHNCKKLKDPHPDASIFNKKEKSTSLNNNNSLLGLCATMYNNVAKNKRVFDSGSPIHICNDITKFSNFQHSDEDEITGLVGKVTIKGYGTVMVGNLLLHNVAYIPNVPFNLISISAATSFSGANFIFDEKLLVKRSDVDVPFTIAIKEGGIYVYSPNTPDVALCANSSNTSSLLPKPVLKPDMAILMHARLGHPGNKAYNQLAAKVGLPKLNMSSYTLCPTCTLSKATLRKGNVSSHEYTAPLQLIQVDLCGPFNYNSNNKYFLTIRDAYSRYYEIIHLSSKGDAAQKIIDWITLKENFFSSRGGYKVGAIRSDNGKEFMSNQFHGYLNTKGIEHQLTIPYQSFQNGVVERAHRSIEEKNKSFANKR